MLFLCKGYDVELMFSDYAQKFSDILEVKTENPRGTASLSVKFDIIGKIGVQPSMIPVNLISKIY